MLSGVVKVTADAITVIPGATPLLDSLSLSSIVCLATSSLMYSKKLTIIIFNHNGRIWRSDVCIWRYRFTRAEGHNCHEFFNVFWYVIIHHGHIKALKAIIVPKWSQNHVSHLAEVGTS